METGRTEATNPVQAPLIPDATKSPPKASVSVIEAKALPAPKPVAPAKVLETKDIELELLEEDPDNLRKEYSKEGLQQLCDAMIAQGQLEPIRVRKAGKKYRIIFGHRRARAAKLSKGRITHLRAEVVDEGGDVVGQQLSENEHREGLKLLERSAGHQAYAARGMSIPDIAKATQTSEATVRDSLKLQNLVPAVKKAWVDDGAIDYSIALELAKMPGQIQPAILKEGLEENARRAKDSHEPDPLTVRGWRALIVTGYLLDLKTAPFEVKDAQLVPKAGACTTCPKRTGAAAQQDLFVHLKKGVDLCLEKPCFDAKRDALLERAKAEGKKVLSEAEAKKAFDKYGGDHRGGLNWGADFVPADLKDYGEKTAREKVKPEDVVLAKNPFTGVVLEVVPKAALPKPKEPGYDNSSWQKQQKKYAAERKAEAAITKRIDAQLRDVVAKKHPNGLTPAQWRNLGDQLGGYYTAGDHAKKRGWDMGWKKAELPKLNIGALILFCFEVMGHADALMKALGIDEKVLRANAKKQIADEKKAKDAPKPKKPDPAKVLKILKSKLTPFQQAAQLEKMGATAEAAQLRKAASK